MALIKVKDLHETIQLIKKVLEKLDEIYHILKDEEKSNVTQNVERKRPDRKRIES